MDFKFSYVSLLESTAGQGYGGGLYEVFQNYTNTSGNYQVMLENYERLSPANASKFYRLVPQESTDALDQIRQTQALISQQNTYPNPYVTECIAEAFYYIPMVIAGQLQQNGFYLEALGWYQLIYNYNAPESTRKVYYGLDEESNITALYDKSVLYLEDNINPHTIALTRPQAYTRFTAASIALCLIQYADAEFTEDTAESVSRADELYNQALRLIKTFTYNAQFSACETALGTLNVTITDAAWQPVWDRLVEKLRHIESASVLTTLITTPTTGLNALMQNTAIDINVRFTTAEANINAQLALQQESGTITTYQQTTAKLHNDAELYVLSQKVNVYPNAVAYAGKGSSSSNAIAFTSKKLLKASSNKMAMHASAIAAVSTADVFTVSAAKTVQGLTTTFKPLPAVNTIALQSYNQPMTYVSGSYNQSVEFTSKALPAAYSVAAPAPEQLTFQVVAANSPYAYTTFNKTKPVTQRISTLVYCVPKNPLMQILQLQADINLYKIRNCRNIAGAVRELAPFSAPTDASSGLPVALNGTANAASTAGLSRLRPTQYRYAFLMERAKNLCNIAQQMESALLSALEKYDAESYSVLQARQAVSIASQTVQLQSLRVNQAEKQLTLAEQQQAKAVYTESYYNGLLGQGVNGFEIASLAMMEVGIGFTIAAAGTELNLSKRLSNTSQVFSSMSGMLSTMASYQRRAEEWSFQRGMAAMDVQMGATQVAIATDGIKIASQEHNISKLQSQHAQDNLNFLNNKFTNAALYAFMSQQLSAVYKFFLSQATTVAKQAAVQLSFERQVDLTNTISGSYYNPPGAGENTNPDDQGNKGITGSARLLKDIYILEDNAVDSNRRKLQVSKTISLSQLDPIAFERFRKEGLLPFSTTHEMFDNDFPGQYLRLIQSVSVNVIALIPPVQGIRATLRSLGPSRVMVGGNITVQEVTIQRDPEMIVLTSGSSIPANGSIPLQQQNNAEMYAPFENSGVVMNWVFSMPQYSNRMDYDSIADIQLTINYTAEYSDMLLNQVIKRLGTTFTAQRGFSMKLFYPEAWYDLLNPAPGMPRIFSFTISEDNFPVNMSDITIKGITMYFKIKPNIGTPTNDTIKINSLILKPESGVPDILKSLSETETINNMVSTNFTSGGGWNIFIGNTPFGMWTVEITEQSGTGISRLIQDDRLEDIILNIQYEANLPRYNQY